MAHPRKRTARGVKIFLATAVASSIWMSWAFAAVAGVADLDRSHYALANTPQLSVTDADLNTNPATIQTVPVTLTSSIDATGISVTLRESSANSGVFDDEVTAVSFSNGGVSNDATNVLAVEEGGLVTLTYIDGAPSGTRTDTATMFSNTATTAFDADSYATAESATITVTDVDGNLDPTVAEAVTVTVTSDSDPIGISVIADESGVNTGVFEGTLSYTEGASDDPGDAISVTPGDTVTASFAEPLYLGGTAARTDTAIVHEAGVVSFDEPRYQVDQVATITLDDGDVNTSALTAESESVSFFSTTDPTGVTVVVGETGLDTGVFTGAGTFTEGTSAGTALEVGQGDLVTAEYVDAAPLGTRSTTAVMFIDSATLSLDKVAYRVNDTAVLTATDVDSNFDPTTAESIDVTITSTDDPTGITVTLDETGPDTAEFSASFAFNTLISIPGTSLEATGGSTITATFLEPAFAGGGATNAIVATARMFANSATIAFDDTSYSLLDSPVVSVIDADANLDPTVAETVDVLVTSASDVTGITLTLTEEGLDSSTFSAPFDVSPDATDAGAGVIKVEESGALGAGYDEPNFEGDGVIARAAASTMNTNATVSFDAQRYAVTDAPVLTLIDPDLNVDPSTVQTFSVDLYSDSMGNMISIDLTEAGTNSSTFTDSDSSFNTTANDDGGDSLLVGEGSDLELEALEATTFDGVPALRDAFSWMLTDSGSLSIDGLRFRRLQTPILTLEDADLNLDPLAIEGVSATVTSTADATGISVDLLETAEDSGVFTFESLAFSATASDDPTDTIHAPDGSTWTVAFDEASFTGTPIFHSDSADMFTDSATAVLDMPIYQLDGTATITVTDVDADADPAALDTVAATLSSTSDPGTADLELTETGISTGIFTGAATFNDSATVGSSLLVASGDSLTATYREPNYEGDALIDATGTARMATDAVIASDGQRYARDDTATIQVFDIDLNTDDGVAEDIDVVVKTASDPSTLTVTLTETGVDTGFFEGTNTFNTTATDQPGGSILAVEGDWVSFELLETTTFAGPDATRTADASMFVDDATVVFDAGSYSLLDTATISVDDVDVNDNPGVEETIDVVVTSSTDGTGITVTATETGVDTNQFTATITFDDTASDEASQVLHITSGDLITAGITEDLFAGGTTTRAGFASAATDGTAFLGADAYALDDVTSITITDADLNLDPGVAETVQVEIASTSDPSTIFVDLVETGTNTGSFSGANGFTTGSSDDAADLIEVAPGDTVTLTYTETSSFDGVDVDRTDSAVMNTTGTIVLDRVRYRLDQAVGITLADPDLDLDPAVIDSAPVALTSSADGVGISVSLTETAADSGEFSGTATLSEAASDDATDVIKVAPGGSLTASAPETSTFEGPDDTLMDTSTIFIDAGTVALDADFYPVTGTATVTVTDVDADLDDGVAETVSVIVRSTSDLSGISVTLTEDAIGSGVFTDSIGFSASASDDASDILEIAPGDQIVAEYQEPAASGAGTITRSDSAIAGTNGAVALDATRYSGDGAVVTMTVTDVDLDSDPGVADSVSVELASDSDPSTINVTLSETGLTTGVFSGTATLLESASDDANDELLVAPGDDVWMTYEDLTPFDGPADLVDTAGVDPAVASIASDTIARGVTAEDLTITGDGFNPGATVTVEATGVTVNSVTVDSAVSLTVNVDVDAAADLGATDVTVTNTNTGTKTCSDCLTIIEPPVITAVDPGRMAQGTTGVVLDITGLNFDGGATVTIGGTGISLDDTSVDSATSIAVTIDIDPTATLSARDITVENPDGGTDSCTGCFEVVAPAIDGDVDGDGTSDLIVGVPGENRGGKADAGAISVIPGTGVGLDATADLLLHEGTAGMVGSNGAGDMFGEALARGDFNGDGIGDIAVGVPFEVVSGRGSAGSVDVLFGSLAGLGTAGNQEWTQDTPAIKGKADPNDFFGAVLAAGDFNGDGFDDLAIGVVGEDVGVRNSGAVNVLFGSQDGLTADGNQYWHLLTATGVSPGAQHGFGGSLSTGDVNNDGFDDVAIGASGASVGGHAGAGEAYVMFGSAAGLTSVDVQTWNQDTGGIPSAARDDEAFGRATVIADFNGDLFDDLAIGVPGQKVGGKSEAGALHVLFGSASGPSATGDLWLHQNSSGVPSGAAPGEQLGAALAAGDVDGDGMFELAVGVPGQRVGGKGDAGALHLFPGSAAGPSTTGDQFWHQNKSGIEDSAEAGDHFGSGLLFGDFNGDGDDDLAVGISAEDIGSKSDAGAVSVIYSDGGGLSSAGDQFWHQDAPSVLGVPSAGERFGIL